MRCPALSLALCMMFPLHVVRAVAAEKLPPPTDAAQEGTLDLVKEICGNEWDAARTDEQKSALGKKLLREAAGIAGLSQVKIERRLKEIAALNLPPMAVADATPPPKDSPPPPTEPGVGQAGKWQPRNGAAPESDGFWKLEKKDGAKLVLAETMSAPWELNFAFVARVEWGGLILRQALTDGSGDQLVLTTQAKHSSNLYLDHEGDWKKLAKSRSHSTQNGRLLRARMQITNGELKFYVHDRLNIEWRDPRVTPSMVLTIGGFKVKVREMAVGPVR